LDVFAELQDVHARSGRAKDLDLARARDLRVLDHDHGVGAGRDHAAGVY
jgi:hypothetical protein